MAKSKNKSAKQVSLLSPEKYIQTKARDLPIKECWVTKNYKEKGAAHLLVARQHASGNVTFGSYLVDISCLGVRDAMYRYNISAYDYEKRIEYLNSTDEVEQISYEKAHNLIYGAIEYAEDLGIAPHKNFRIAQYILEEDTDEIPLIEMEFGLNGMPHLAVSSQSEANRYIPLLEKHTGGKYSVYIWEEEEDFEDQEEEEDDEDFGEALNAALGYTDNIAKDSYTYQRPEYPTVLKLNHPELEALYQTEDWCPLDKETIVRLLQLPKESLIDDLIHIIYVELGRTTGVDIDDLFEKEYCSPLRHALLLLGELKAERSLPAVLEVARQDIDCFIYHFEEAVEEILSLMLYRIGRNQLPALMDYSKEAGLSPAVPTCAAVAVSYIAIHEKERKEEVIGWFRELLASYSKENENPVPLDVLTFIRIISCILDTQLKELVPDLEVHMQTEQMKHFFAKENFIEQLLTGEGNPMYDYSLYNIHELYEKHF